MSQALKRFEELRRKFRSMIPTRKLSATQRHHLTTAAALQQVGEQYVAGMVIGAPHDRGAVDRLQSEVRTHLKLAGTRQ